MPRNKQDPFITKQYKKSVRHSIHCRKCGREMAAAMGYDGCKCEDVTPKPEDYYRDDGDDSEWLEDVK